MSFNCNTHFRDPMESKDYPDSPVAKEWVRGDRWDLQDPQARPPPSQTRQPQLSKDHQDHQAPRDNRDQGLEVGYVMYTITVFAIISAQCAKIFHPMK